MPEGKRRGEGSVRGDRSRREFCTWYRSSPRVPRQQAAVQAHRKQYNPNSKQYSVQTNR